MGDNEACKTSVCLSCAAVELSVGARAETGQAPHELLRTLAGHHSKGVDRLTFLAFERDGIFSLLHSIFIIVGGEY